MGFNVKFRVLAIAARVRSLVDRVGIVWLFLVASLVLLALVVWMNPARLGSYIWFIAKLSAAAALGYGADKAFFPGSEPRYMEHGLERSMAQSRRALMVASAMIAAGLIG